MDNKSSSTKTDIDPTNGQQSSSESVHITDSMHKKNLPRKIPPHMRRLNMRFSSPSDNLSPMSQKLMLADRNNAAARTIRPKALKEVFLSQHQQSDSEFSYRGTQENCQLSGSEDIEKDQALEDNRDELMPPSPTKHNSFGGLVTL